MAAFRRICCPVDFSDRSRAALELAADLARREGSGLVVLHATKARWPGDQGAVLPGSGRESEEIDTLARWTADAEGLRGATVGSVLLSAPAAEAIIGFARTNGVDLLVLASHGRKGLERLALGSVAEAVVRGAPCPVLVVRREEPPPPEPVDGTTGMPA
jgi:nucleotide-binding universal stress UspA family protein